ncbi:MAG: lipo-like protein [Rhodocyclales bacterium]|nr:lipo-like protein [Rhodocyclales bacterium]
MNPIMNRLGNRLASYLSRPDPRYRPLATSDPRGVAAAIVPGDVLLVEGNTRFSKAIKYLSQSTWSHAALYVGDAAGEGERHWLVEADVVDGVIAVPLEKYADMHTRICRPAGLTAEDRAKVIGYALARIGHRYDLKNILDLVRYLLPQPPVPVRWRRRMLSLGSGDPTRAICSTLIAQAFQSVRYPILPSVTRKPAARDDCNDCYDEILHIRHHSLFVPRDFDISPYFEIVKPTLARGFDYRQLRWDDASSEA